MQPGKTHKSIVVSALSARNGFGTVLLSIRDYVRLAAPEPEVLRLIGEESKSKGTDKLTTGQIEKAIKAARAAKSKRG